MQYNKPFDKTDPTASFVNGNPSAGIEGSIPPAEAIEYPQREIVQAIVDAGLSPTNSDLTQLSQAIRRLGNNRLFWGVDAGAANAMVITASPVLTTFQAGDVFVTIPAQTNTNTTVNANISSLGNKRIFKSDGTTVPALGDIKQSRLTILVYDGTALRMNYPSTSDLVQSIPASANNVQIFNTHGTSSFMVPANVFSIIVEGIGAGAGGTAGSIAQTGMGGGGGGAGAYGYGVYAVTPGASHTVIIGQGGAGSSTNGLAGSPGTSTSFGSLLTCPGAPITVVGGSALIASGQPGGSAGTGGLLNLTGGRGNDGMPGASYLGGAGGATKFGAGGAAGMPNGGNGTGYGSGGGGSYTGGPNVNNPASAAGSGADGAVLVYWSA